MQAEKKRSGAMWFWIGFLIPTLVTVIGFVIIGVWPAGDGTVLIIDSLHQYLPFYTEYHEKLVHHQSLLYSFSAGFGYNFWATWAYYLASPLNLLIVLVPTANVCDFMDLMILLKIGLCGGTFTWYLHRRRPSSGALSVAFGTMYALSFFVIGYYFNLMWLDSIAMLPLILCGIEQICGIGPDRVRTACSDGRLYGLALFYGVWCNYYIGFMLCIFSVLYYLVCTVAVSGQGVGRFLRRSLRFAWYSLLAGGMGAVVLLPAYRALTASEAMRSNSFPTSVKFYTDFVNLMLTHFAGIPPINIADTQVGLNAYCGVAVMILTLLYFLDGRIRLRERLAHAVLIGFLLLSFSLNILNYIWHGFHQQNGLPNRFAFLYVGLLLVLSFDVAGDLKQLAVWRLALAGALPLAFAVCAYALRLGTDSDKKAYPREVYGITVLLLAGYLLLLLVLRLGPLRRKAAMLLMSGALLLEAGASGVYGIVCNDSVTRSIYLADQKSYKSLMAEIGDTDWFRSEVDAQRMRNVTLFCGGNSTVMFNSTMQESVTDFCDAIGMEARTNKNGYNGVTRLMNDVFGIRYVLSANGTGSSLYGMQERKTDGNLTVYENPDALPIGFLVNSDITQWTTKVGTPIEVQDSFVTLATGHAPIYTLDRYLTPEDGVENGIRIPEGKEVYLYLPSRVKDLRLTTPEYSKTYTTFTDHLYVIDACDGKNDATVKATVTGTAPQAILYTCPLEQVKEVRDLLARNVLENVRAEGSRLSGTLTADRDGELLLTIPYDRNWTCVVDGAAVEADVIGEALMGIALTAGTHTVALSYLPDGLRIGALCSLLCAALFVLTFLLERRRSKREEAQMAQRDLTGRAAKPEQPDAFASEEDREDLVRRLREINTPDAVRTDEPMHLHTTFRTGGPADVFVQPPTEEALVQSVALCRERDVPWQVIGNGSNLLVSDAGYRGVLLRVGRNLSEIRVEGCTLRAQAGALLYQAAKAALDNSLTGLECESGIPGTLGGALSMNAGAYGGEMKDITRTVRVLDADGQVRTLTGDEMAFGYRTSIVQREDMIVLSAELELKPGDAEQIRRKMQELREKRVEKQPLDLPSAGSTFKRPEGYYAGALIEQAGLRGFSVGGAQVSEKHCGFVVNRGEATSGEIRQLIKEVQERVYAHSGVQLEPEVRMVGEFEA